MLTLQGRKGNGASHRNGAPRIVATYDYIDEGGTLLYQVVRYEPKGFRQRRPDGKGDWVWNLQGVRRVLFRLPELLQAPLDQPVFTAEGEKDVDNLRGLGLLATTNAMGAGKWLNEYCEVLRSRHVFILPDNDEVGRAHAQAVERSLAGIAASVTIVELPDLPPKGDVSNWLAVEGNDKEKLLQLALNAATTSRAGRGVGSRGDGRKGKAKLERPEPVLLSLADIQALPIEWLWPQWIPRGAITLLDGDPGLGKSTIAIDIASRVTRNWAMPSGGSLGRAAGVLLLSAEDDVERTIRPRLDVAAADVSQVIALEAVKAGDEERPPVLPWDLELVEEMIAKRDIALIVVDPLAAYLDSEIDAHKDQDIRRCLHLLKLIAQRTRAAILVIRHLNKCVGSPALYRGGGSIGIIGAARSALIVGRDPNNPRTYVLASNKSNLGASPQSLTYSVDSVGDVARIAWGGETALTAGDILMHAPGAARKSVGDQCAQALAEILAGGAQESAEVDETLKQMGYSENAIKKARSLCRVKARRVGYGAEGRWMVFPPEEAVPDHVDMQGT